MAERRAEIHEEMLDPREMTAKELIEAGPDLRSVRREMVGRLAREALFALPEQGEIAEYAEHDPGSGIWPDAQKLLDLWSDKHERDSEFFNEMRDLYCMEVGHENWSASDEVYVVEKLAKEMSQELGFEETSRLMGYVVEKRPGNVLEKVWERVDEMEEEMWRKYLKDRDGDDVIDSADPDEFEDYLEDDGEEVEEWDGMEAFSEDDHYRAIKMAEENHRKTRELAKRGFVQKQGGERKLYKDKRGIWRSKSNVTRRRSNSEHIGTRKARIGDEWAVRSGRRDKSEVIKGSYSLPGRLSRIVPEDVVIDEGLGAEVAEKPVRREIRIGTSYVEGNRGQNIDKRGQSYAEWYRSKREAEERKNGGGGGEVSGGFNSYFPPDPRLNSADHLRVNQSDLIGDIRLTGNKAKHYQ